MAKIFLPDSVPGPEAVRLAASLPSLAGRGSRSSTTASRTPNVVMTRAAETLASRVGATVTLVTKKGPGGRSANAAIPCAEDIFERVVNEADIVITGAADCGSCTAYSVHDAIELEKAGRPAVVVTTTKFEPIALDDGGELRAARDAHPRAAPPVRRYRRAHVAHVGRRRHRPTDRPVHGLRGVRSRPIGAYRLRGR